LRPGTMGNAMVMSLFPGSLRVRRRRARRFASVRLAPLYRRAGAMYRRAGAMYRRASAPVPTCRTSVPTCRAPVPTCRTAVPTCRAPCTDVLCTDVSCPCTDVPYREKILAHPDLKTSTLNVKNFPNDEEKAVTASRDPNRRGLLVLDQTIVTGHKLYVAASRHGDNPASKVQPPGGRDRSGPGRCLR
jgi:hypothetical protein